MLHKSLLVTLSNQRQTELKSFKENYLTAVLAYILNENKSLLKDYLRSFLKVPTGASALNVEIQRPCENGRIDLEIYSHDVCLFQENKIEAQEGPKQLERYARAVKRQKQKHRGLIYLTKVEPERKRQSLFGIPIHYKLWIELSSFLDKHRNKHGLLISEVISLLEANGMALPRSVDLRGLKDTWALFAKQKPVLDDIVQLCITKARQEFGSEYDILRRTDDFLAPGLLLKKSRGSLRVPMENDQVWIWSGIYLWEEEDVYVATSVGWNRVKPGCQPKVKNYPAVLERNGFLPWDSEGPRYEEFVIEESLTKIVGRGNNFSGQRRAVSDRMIKSIRRACKVFKRLY